MKLTAHQNDRAAGVLLAAAAGDALGAGYEFSHPAPGTPIDMIGGGPFNWAPGEWTDDTAMTVAIAEIAATGVDIGRGAGLDAVAAQFVRWYDTDPTDIGNQTRSVLSTRPADAAAMTAQARSLPGHTAGNGSLMRTAPVALAYLDDEQGCLDAAAAVSDLTHADPTAAQACQLWCHAIRIAVLTGTFDGVRGFLAIAPTEVADHWRPLLDQAESGNPTDFANNGWVVHALQTAWWAITHTDDTGPEQLQHALEAAVLAGGDTDTTAAIAGALLGARWGAAAVPDRWRRILHGWPGLDANDLTRLATLTGGHDDRRGRPTVRVAEGDITTLEVDVVVNAANRSLLGGGGVDGAIHRAGGPQILAACEMLRETTLPDGLDIGATVATTAGRMPARWIVHTVGPRHSDTEDRSALLRACYIRSLRLAESLGARTVAFPLISSGSYGWPKADAVRQAVAAIRSTVTGVEEVVLVAYDAEIADLMRKTLT